MLQTIREYTQGWIAGVIISLIILSFALWGIHSYIGSTHDANIAKVNGIDITREQLSIAYDRLRRQSQAEFKLSDDLLKTESLLKDQALQNLIETEVLKQSALKQGFKISDDQVDHYLESMPEFQVDGQFSLDKFQEVLSYSLLSTSEFIDLIRTNLLIEQPRLGFVLTAFALPSEAQNMVNLVNQERLISYLKIPSTYFLTQTIPVSMAEIKAYYDDHQSEFMTAEQASIDYIKLSLDEIKKSIHPNDTVLRQFYAQNLNVYTQPMLWDYVVYSKVLPESATKEVIEQNKQLFHEFLQAVQGGQLPQEAAKKYQLTLTHHRHQTLQQVPEVYRNVLSNLKLNRLSEVIVAAQDMSVLQVINISVSKIQGFDEVKDKVQQAYIQQHAEEQFANLKEQLSSAVYEHPDNLSYASKLLNLPIYTTELFSKDTPGTAVLQHQKIRNLAFSHDIMDLGNNSEVVQLDPETALAFRIKTHLRSELPALNNMIQNRITEKLKTVKAEEKLSKFVEELKSRLDAGMDAQDLAKQYKLSWLKSSWLSRYSTKVDSAVIDLAFRLPHPKSSKKLVYGIVRLPDAYAIVALENVKPGTLLDKKQYAVYAEQFQTSEGLLEYQLYKQGQIKAAKIKINQRG